MPKINVGNVVQLKSGGPNMTVVKKSPDDQDYLDCVWFSHNEILEEKSFLPATLRVVSEKPLRNEEQWRLLIQLHDKQVLSTQTLLEEVDINYEQEVKRLRK